MSTFLIVFGGLLSLLVRDPKVIDSGLVLNDRSLLSSKTEVKSGYEKAFREGLLRLGIRSHYEPFSFRVRENTRETQYTPDFVTNLTVNGRRVLLEPHGMRNARSTDIQRDLAKFGQFLDTYRKWFYLVVASNMPMEFLSLRAAGSIPHRFADEYWLIMGSGDGANTAHGDIYKNTMSMLQRFLRKSKVDQVKTDQI